MKLWGLFLTAAAVPVLGAGLLSGWGLGFSVTVAVLWLAVGLWASGSPLAAVSQRLWDWVRRGVIALVNTLSGVARKWGVVFGRLHL